MGDQNGEKRAQPTIVPYAASLAKALAAIAAAAPDPWALEVFEKLPEQPHKRCFVALLGGEVAGFACFLALEGSADLELLAVAPARRRRGLGEALLRHGFEALCGEGIRRCLLEVRAGNTAAIALYEKLGFQTLALRKGMYQHPAEDGLLMARAL